MPIIASNAKRVKTNAKSGYGNKVKKTRVKTVLKKFNQAVAENDLETATELFNTANSLLDKSVTSNIRHKNYAARKKSHIAVKLNELNAA